jgi:hypothetical protein
MLQIKNTSGFAAAMCVFPDEQGVDTLYVVVKGTFRLAPRLERADEQVPVTAADEYHGDPAETSLKAATEMHTGKPATDVILSGSAWAPGGRLADNVVVGMSVAGRKKGVQVFGDRRWSGVLTKPSRPEPFTSIPLRWERSYGGIHKLPDKPGRLLAEERNPAGVGFRGKRATSEAAGQPVPNIEDPTHLIGSYGDAPAPVGFGFIAPSWLPRRALGGTYDAAWEKKRAPYLPADFQPQFLNAAPPDQIFAPYLAGGEPVVIAGASREGQLRFALPTITPAVAIKVAGRHETPPLHLETVLIEPDDNRLCLSWRARLPCDKQALKIQEIAISG